MGLKIRLTSMLPERWSTNCTEDRKLLTSLTSSFFSAILFSSGMGAASAGASAGAVALSLKETIVSLVLLLNNTCLNLHDYGCPSLGRFDSRLNSLGGRSSVDGRLCGCRSRLGDSITPIFGLDRCRGDDWISLLGLYKL